MGTNLSGSIERVSFSSDSDQFYYQTLISAQTLILRFILIPSVKSSPPILDHLTGFAALNRVGCSDCLPTSCETMVFTDQEFRSQLILWLFTAHDGLTREQCLHNFSLGDRDFFCIILVSIFVLMFKIWLSFSEIWPKNFKSVPELFLSA